MGRIQKILNLLAILADSNGIQRCKLLLMINDSIISLGEEMEKLEHEKLVLEEKIKDLESKEKQDE